MIEFVFVISVIVEQILLFKIAFKLGIKTEQQARLKRMSALMKLLNGNAKI